MSYKLTRESDQQYHLCFFYNAIFWQLCHWRRGGVMGGEVYTEELFLEAAVEAPADQLPVAAAPTAFQNWVWLLRLSRVGPLCLDNRHAPSWKRFCQSKRALATIIRTLNFPFDAWEWYATDINWTHKRSYLRLGLWWKARVFQIAFEFFISYICHLSLSGLCLAPFARSLLQSYNRFFEDIHECHSSIAIQCIDVYDTVCGLWIVNCGRC